MFILPIVMELQLPQDLNSHETLFFCFCNKLFHLEDCDFRFCKQFTSKQFTSLNTITKLVVC